jgi:16S rRNA (guanine527-N7)-methyltransferase
LRLAAGVLDAGQQGKLTRFAELLRQEGVRIGAISAGDTENIWDRHIQDSLRSLACLASDRSEVFDLGSGAGLPGIPVAIARPDVRIALIESKTRRAAFLEYAVEMLAIQNARVLPARCEAVHETANVCLARALAPPLRAWDLAAPLLRPGGALLYFAGRSWGDRDVSELEQREVTSKICVPGEFPWQGPIVMMTRRGTKHEHRS